ncbi:protein EXECUTER 1, chloroplastic-like isoform X2 [Mangifera indica]|uniref:protein EXECUTER 1, chloroplastic-like isoform X2 n=1 Tax=Mangifera indica TaxID=29780 RepID=UPI001CFB1789|nr:protein EXECUTER 1, chloroplastic-like isoform X2 [Mangifera indica]
MASISSSPSPHQLTFPPTPHKFFLFKRQSCSFPLSPFSDSTLCRSSSSSGNNSTRLPWDFPIHDLLNNLVERFHSFFNSHNHKDIPRNDTVSVNDDWDWERWKNHFEQVDEQERLVSILKSQLGNAVYREEYGDAARLKVAIAAAANNDTVGRVMSSLNRAVVEERYEDAAILRDKASTGLVGWWAGISEDKNDPYGLIIRVTAEHGKYVARSYSPRQLATAAVGVPLFEIYLTMNKKGEYKQQAVYLRKTGAFEDSSKVSSKASGATSGLNPSGSTEDNNDLLGVTTEDVEDGEDTDDNSDLAEGLSGFQNILQDMIPGVRVKVLKVTAPGKLDRDFISKVIEQIIEEEDEEKDIEVENAESEDEDEGESESDSDQEGNEVEVDAVRGIMEIGEQSEITVKVMVGGLVQKLSGSMPVKERVPAKLEKKGHSSFSFSFGKDGKQQDSGPRQLTSVDRKAKLRGQRGMDSVMFDLAKFVGKEKIPLKVLKDLGELINLSLSQAQNRQPLSGSTIFQRIEIASPSDPLNGLYIGAHGLYTSEVIHLSRKVGQWKDDGGARNSSNLEFYEYVEAIKVTGDPYVPAGQVAFRAKIGKRYQLPHKGIIPEEFGVSFL